MTQVFSKPTLDTSTDNTRTDELPSNAADPFAFQPAPQSCNLCLNKPILVHDPNLSSLTGTAPNPIRMVKPIIEGDFFSVTAGIQVGIIPNKSVSIIRFAPNMNSRSA